jgi:hypothetical protein
MKLRLLVVIVTVMLATFACGIEILADRAPSHRADHGTFSTRLQPTPPIDSARVAGLGSIKELRPVETTRR